MMEYNAMPGVRATALKALAVGSPLHYFYAMQMQGDGTDETPSRVFLRAVHCAILEPDVFQATYAEYTDSAARRGQAWKLWQATHHYITGLLPSEWKKIQLIQSSVNSHKGAFEVLSCYGKSEICIQWIDSATRMACKAKVDRLSIVPLEVWDLKAVPSVHPDELHRQIRRLGWALQLAHYEAGVEAIYGERPRHCGLICYETGSPYDIAVYELPETMMEEARVLRRDLMETIADCTRRNLWPGTAPDRIELPAPSWATDEDLDETDTDAYMDADTDANDDGGEK